MLHRYRRDAHRVRMHAIEMIAFSEEKGFPDHLAKGVIFKGWANAMLGQVEQGLEDMHNGLEAQRAIGTKEDFPVYFDMIAEAYQAAGQPDLGLTRLAEGFEVADESGIHYWDAELHRRKGLLLTERGIDHASEAEECFLKALDISRKQEARSLELRAAVSLSRLWHSTAKVGQAQQLLSNVIGWFPAEAETVDLAEARGVLESLNRSSSIA